MNLNPNPISKLFMIVLLSTTLLHPLHPLAITSLVIAYSFFYLLQCDYHRAISNLLMYIILNIFTSFSIFSSIPFAIQLLVSIFLIFKLFYIPIMAGKYLLTSDVGSILSSLDALHVPNTISIPLAVMFRFFPSFKEERKHIKNAMRIRHISIKNPVKYVLYVFVPLLIISSNIADDIAKAAETKCIANPIHKVRYTKVSMQLIDFIFLIIITCITIGGWYYA